MGVRTRIKSMIKKLILRQKESTEQYTPPGAPKQSKTSFEPVQAPSQPEEVAPVSTAPVVENVETPPTSKEGDVAAKSLVLESDAETSATETDAEEIQVAASEPEAKEIEKEDTNMSKEKRKKFKKICRLFACGEGR